MQKALDRIYEAYYDGMGEEFGRKVRERIHWICSQAKGEKILDIGCSQGITSILLAREGKKVLGIDLSKESIEFAKGVLEDEKEITKRYVEFRTANFIDYDFKDEKFDSIIMAEILEHLTDPERFIKKASELLNENGQVIITVPFGINEYFNHKKTYYLADLISEVAPYLKIKRIKFFSKWIGVTAGKKADNINEYNIKIDTLIELEKTFNEIEIGLLENIKTQIKNYNVLKEKYQKTEENYKKMKENYLNSQAKLKDLSREKEKEIEKMKKEKEEIADKYKAVLSQKLEKEKEIEKKYEDILKKLINVSILAEDYMLKYKALDLKNKELQNKFNCVSRRYKALRNSKLGKLTLKFWKIRKNMKNGWIGKCIAKIFSLLMK